MFLSVAACGVFVVFGFGVCLNASRCIIPFDVSPSFLVLSATDQYQHEVRSDAVCKESSVGSLLGIWFWGVLYSA